MSLQRDREPQSVAGYGSEVERLQELRVVMKISLTPWPSQYIMQTSPAPGYRNK